MPELDLDREVKLAIYEITAETGSVPTSSQVSRKINIDENESSPLSGACMPSVFSFRNPAIRIEFEWRHHFRACRPGFQLKRMASTITRIAFGTPTESQRRCIAMRSAAL